MPAALTGDNGCDRGGSPRGNVGGRLPPCAPMAPPLPERPAVEDGGRVPSNQGAQLVVPLRLRDNPDACAVARAPPPPAAAGADSPLYLLAAAAPHAHRGAHTLPLLPHSAAVDILFSVPVTCALIKVEVAEVSGVDGVSGWAETTYGCRPFHRVVPRGRMRTWGF